MPPDENNNTSSSTLIVPGEKKDGAPTATPKGTSSSPTKDLSGTLDRTQEIEKKLKKVEMLLDIARRCNLNIDDPMPDCPTPAAQTGQQGQSTPAQNVTAYEKLESAYDKFYKTEPDLNGAYRDLSCANKILTKVLSRETQRFPYLKYWSFQSMLYGYTPISLSILAVVFFSYLLVKNGFWWIPPVFQPGNVPLWAALFGGLGACAQILIGVVAEIREDGAVSDYKRIWYLVLPFIALIFGFLAYLLADLGLMTLGGGQGGQSASVTAANISLIKATGANTLDLLNNAAGNYSFTAKNVTKLTATGVGSFTSNVGVSARVVLCFLAGYGTDAFIKRLTNLAEKM